MEKIFFYDLETTGTDPNVHAIHQLSAIVRMNGKVVNKVNLKIRPFEGAVIDPEALKVGGVTHDEIMSEDRLSYAEAYKYLTKMLGTFVSRYDKKDKLHLCGYNISSFDNPFLRKLWERNGDVYFGSFFWSDSIDVMSEASSFLRRVRPEMENFKLFTVARTLRLTVNEELLHDALYDVELTADLFDRIENVRKQVK